jgi:hypothetical protein
MGAGFDTYTELIRQLSALRADDATRTAAGDDAARTVQAQQTALEARHHQQSTHLVQLAQVLKQPAPTFDTPPADPVTDPREALRQAATEMDGADGAARQAEQAAEQPVLLPAMSPLGRAVTIYVAFAVAGWLLQCGLYAVSTETDFGTLAWSLCGLPAIAFFAGYLTVATLGQPRLPGTKHPTHARLGGLTCFIGMPVAWLGILIAFSLLAG